MVTQEATQPVEQVQERFQECFQQQFEKAPSELLEGETILLLEDEDNLRLIVQEVLEAAGYTVFAAATPAQAADLFDQHQPAIQLVLSDCLMADGDAASTVESFRSRSPGLPVLYMSGHHPDAIAQHGVSLSKFHFLPKPFGFAALRAAVRAALDERPIG